MAPKYFALIIFAAFTLLGIAVFAFSNQANIAQTQVSERKVNLDRPEPTPGMDVDAKKATFVSFDNFELEITLGGAPKKFKVDESSSLFSCVASEIPMIGGGTAKLKDAYIDVANIDINKDPRVFTTEKFITISDIGTLVNQGTLVIYLTENSRTTVGPYKQKFIFTDCN